MEENKIFSKVFMWMFIGLLITFGVGAIVAANENMVYNVFHNLYIWLVLAQFGVVIFLSARLQKMQEITATILFVLYSALTGLTFSSIFVVFDFIGYFTKMNLLKWHTYLFMALFGLILA